MTDSDSKNPMLSPGEVLERATQYCQKKEYAKASKCYLAAAIHGDAICQTPV